MKWPWWVTLLFGGGVALVTTFAPDAFPNNIRVAGFYLGTGLVGLSLLAGVLHLARVYLTAHDANQSPPVFVKTWRIVRDDAWPIRLMIPLDCAARRALRATSGLFAGDAARSLGSETGGPLGYMAALLTNDGEIPVFGYVDEWSPFVEIPKDRMQQGHISDDARTLVAFGEKKPMYTGLAIRRRDFKRRIADIKTWK